MTESWFVRRQDKAPRSPWLEVLTTCARAVSVACTSWEIGPQAAFTNYPLAVCTHVAPEICLMTPARTACPGRLGDKMLQQHTTNNTSRSPRKPPIHWAIAHPSASAFEHSTPDALGLGRSTWYAYRDQSSAKRNEVRVPMRSLAQAGITAFLAKRAQQKERPSGRQTIPKKNPGKRSNASGAGSKKERARRNKA